ncbi:MAG: hypothetical protein DMF15_08310 [Verrucomicrobia bacterium]|nr:MAG: hypothetical protein DMF15_08310 [Verrucomicrobiota bacterium]
MFYRRSTLVVLLTLIFLSFFGTLSLSAWMFPDSYDWRYRVISSLLSPRDNPRHYWLAASGLALTAVLMLPFAEHLRRHLQSIAPRMAKFDDYTNFWVAPPPDVSQRRCCVGACAHGMAALKTRPPPPCFGSGHS